MKELSIEEKAKAYDRVVKEVKDFFEGRQKMYSDVEQTLEYLFPELKESDEEKVRKCIYNILQTYPSHTTLFKLATREECFAWLEKQGEQKLAEWSEEDEEIANKGVLVLKSSAAGFPTDEKFANEFEIWLKSLKERYTWKPKKEQIKAVKEAACYSSVFSEKTIDNLISLSKQLKAL